MRNWVVQIRRKSRKELPSTFWLQATDDDARELEKRIRRMFEQGQIKDFLFEPVQVSSFVEVADEIIGIEHELLDS